MTVRGTQTREDAVVSIVGGGVHGTHLAVRLLESGLVTHDQLRIVDPNGLLGNFRRQCEQCGLRELRSPFVHTIDTDPFSLGAYARSNGRTDELRSSGFGGDRPVASLFFDHTETVCATYDLDSLLIEERVTGLDERSTGVHLETTAGSFDTDWCLLAVGYGGSRTLPEWADALPHDAPATHVWNPEFDPAEIGPRASVGIVGGGITAAQLATALARPGREVTMFARTPISVESLEAKSEWMHFSSAVEQLQALPPASEARAQVVDDARNDGTVPPHVFQPLRRAIGREAVGLQQTTVEECTSAGGIIVVTCENGRARCLDRLAFATGFGSPYDAGLFGKLRTMSSLAVGYRGAPVLDDDTLRWRRADGSLSRVFVSGAAARQVLGPFAPNIIGAREAGALVVDELERAVAAGASVSPRPADGVE